MSNLRNTSIKRLRIGTNYQERASVVREHLIKVNTESLLLSLGMKLYTFRSVFSKGRDRVTHFLNHGQDKRTHNPLPVTRSFAGLPLQEGCEVALRQAGCHGTGSSTQASISQNAASSAPSKILHHITMIYKLDFSLLILNGGEANITLA